MNRALWPKGRAYEQPAGTAYSAVHGRVAMLHALKIDPAFQRLGLRQHLTYAVAIWGQRQGANHLALIPTRANLSANALYASLGMAIVGKYYYLIKTSE